MIEDEPVAGPEVLDAWSAAEDTEADVEVELEFGLPVAVAVPVAAERA